MSNDIYSYIKENFGIEIINYKFKRDYIQNPLRKFKNQLLNEKPIKEDVEYLYITINLTSNDIGKIINRSPDYISGYAKKLGIFKPKELMIRAVENSVFRKIGRKNYFEGKIGAELVKQAVQKKYGCDYAGQVKEIREKAKKTLKEKYNIDNPRYIPHLIESYKDPEFIKKMNKERYKTRKKNNTFVISKPELKILEILKTKFPNTITQYSSELYPFACDFYIPEKDLYIEYQGHWKHGKEPYIGTPEQIKIVQYWKTKSEELNFKGEPKRTYADAINNWTNIDVYKRNTVHKNNLNWIEFFNMKEFEDWFNQV